MIQDSNSIWKHEKENRLGYIWFCGATLFATILAIMLYRIDIYLETDNRRERIGDMLHVLRVAQTTIAQSEIDPRTGQLPSMEWFASVAKDTPVNPDHNDTHAAGDEGNH